MAIYLIGKIKPKNNGTFAMVDAADVEMPDGSRLSEFKGGVTSVNGQTGDVTIEIPEMEAITVDNAFSLESENPVQNKVITQNFNNAMQILLEGVIPNLLPSVTNADDGKFLQVVNGAWVAATMEQWVGGEY